MIGSHWLFIRVVNRVQSTNSHDWLFGWLIIQRRFDYDCLINQLAWLIIWQWLSHIDYSWLINQLIKLIIHSSSQSSSINQLAWLIIRVIDYFSNDSTRLFNQPARVLFVINQPTHQNWLFIRVVNRVQSTNSQDWLFVWLIISAMIRRWWFNQPARVIDYSTMIESHWLFIRVVNRVQSTNS